MLSWFNEATGQTTKNKPSILPTNGVKTTVVCDTPALQAHGEYLKLY